MASCQLNSNTLKPRDLTTKQPYPARAAYYGATAATGNALGRRNDNMFCNAAAVPYFTLVSSLRLVRAQYARHGLPGRGAWGDKPRTVA
jgi:hypothetical protein